MALNERSPFANNFLSIKHHSICRELNPAPVTDEEKAEAIAQKYKEVTVENPSDIQADGSKETVQKWIRTFGSIDGVITGLEWYDREQNISNRKVRFCGLKMKIKDDEMYLLDLPYGHKGYDVYTRVMEDIDYSKPIEISAWHDKKAGNATAVLFRQGGNSIKWRYTKEWNNNVLQALGADKKTEQLAAELAEAFEHSDVPEALMDKVEKAGHLICPPPVYNELAKPQWNFDKQRAWLWTRLQNIVIPRVQELNPKFDEPMPDDLEFSGPALEAAASAAPAVTAAPTAAPVAAEDTPPWEPPGLSEGNKTDAAF